MNEITSLIVGVALSMSQGGRMPNEEAVDRIVSRSVSPGSPGCSVAVSTNGKQVFAKGYGIADLEHMLAVTPETRFAVASVTKQFTAAAIMLLASEGKLALTDDIRKYLTEMPDYGTPITIQNLLSHTAGLRDFHSLAYLQGWRSWGQRQFTQAEIVDLIAGQKALNFTPGSKFSYTNSGYVLADEIVRRVSQMPTGTFMAERFFKPLGMTSTQLRDDYRTLIDNRASGYTVVDKKTLLAPASSIHGSENLVSTPSDLLKWNAALDSGELSSNIKAGLQTEGTITGGKKTGYGGGLQIRDYRGLKEIAHSGSANGFTAYSARYPSKGVAVAAACNSEQPTTMIARQVADLWLGLPPMQDRRPPMMPPPGASPQASPGGALASSTDSALNKLAGAFLDEVDGQLLRLEVKDGTLGEPKAPPLQRVADNRFTAPWGEFVFTGTDKIRLQRQDGTTTDYVRVDGARQTPQQLRSLEGRYYSPELKMSYVVVSNQNGLSIRGYEGPSLDIPLVNLGGYAFLAEEDTYRFVPAKSGSRDLVVTTAGVGALRLHRQR